MVAPVFCLLALALVCINSKCIAATEAVTVGDNSAMQVFSAPTKTRRELNSRQTTQIEPVRISVLTVTQFMIIAGSMHETHAPPTATGIMTSPDNSASLLNSAVVDPGTAITSFKWTTWLVRPIYAMASVAVALFSYVLVPAWVSLLWAIRVLLFRPAVLIYLLFLERPFQAATSLFMWILPLLSFAIATTIIGTLIGGTFGWISAVAVGFVKAPVESSDNKRKTWSAQPTGAADMAKPRPQATLEGPGSPKPEDAFAERAIVIRSSRPPHGSQMWTRRRRSRRASATATAPT